MSLMKIMVIVGLIVKVVKIMMIVYNVQMNAAPNYLYKMETQMNFVKTHVMIVMPVSRPIPMQNVRKNVVVYAINACVKALVMTVMILKKQMM